MKPNKSMNENEMRVNDSAAHAPEEVRKWAKKLSETHGCAVVLSREVSGYHAYLPCPECLKTHGRKELDDPKYAINLSMLAGLGEYKDREAGYEWMPEKFMEREELRKTRQYRSGICMRTRSAREPHRFPIDDLMNMGTVTERHPDILTKAAVFGGAGSAEREDMWEDDPISGVSCPPPAGEVIPLDELPAEHPAVAYLTERGYNIDDLSSQFRAGFCLKEYPEGDKSIYYRKMPGGWKDTPQHRIILYSLIDGAPLTWQARVIEKVSDDELTKLMLHPYAGGFYPGFDTQLILRSFKKEVHDVEAQMIRDDKRQGYWLMGWSRTHVRANPKAAWQPIPPFDETRDGVMKFKPSKYRTAKYSSRQLMGWDAACARADADPDDAKWVVLCEGPLDAARIGPGGVAVIGSSLSMENAARIVKRFHLVFTAFDTDEAGRGATEKVASVLQSGRHRETVLIGVIKLPVPEGKDVGDLSPAEYRKIFTRALRRSQRQR